MSVGGSTLVSVISPADATRAPDGYGRRPLARLALADPELAGPELARLELAEIDLAEIEFAVVDLETTGWSPEAAAITEIGAVRVRGGRRQGSSPLWSTPARRSRRASRT